MSAGGSWVDDLAREVRQIHDTADRLDALEALIHDLNRRVASLDAAVRGQIAAQDAEALRRRAVEAEARTAEG